MDGCVMYQARFKQNKIIGSSLLFSTGREIKLNEQETADFNAFIEREVK